MSRRVGRADRSTVRRQRLVWLVSVPLMIAGSEAAHVLAYRLAYPDPRERVAALTSSGHGYFAYAPLFLAIGIALVASALFSRASEVRAHADRQSMAVSPAPFGALPPATFVLQEHLERLVHGGSLPFGAALEPTFLLGLALQLPFGLAVYLIARLLLRAAEKLGDLLRGARPPRHAVVPPIDSRRFPVFFAPPRLAPLALGASGRGPPGSDSGGTMPLLT